jgi:O-antigen/teichoic acid export membrane protein
MKKIPKKKFSFNIRSLTLNVFWNLLGSGAPLLAAIFAIPVIIEGLGIERFGVLTIAWMVVGYFSLFDLGLGRAVTKLVAEKLGSGDDDELPSIIWTAMLLMMVLGVLAAVFVAMISPWFSSSLLNIPLKLQPETLKAFYLLAASIPIVIITAGLRGILEAYQRFDYVNVVRIPLGMLTYLGPVAVLSFSNSLVPIVAILVIGRFLSLCAYIVLCLKVEPILRSSFSMCWTMARRLITFGGWITVSNIISPVMSYLDRFLIGAVVTMTAVSYYATPYEIIIKLGIITGAIMGVMFPTFATILAQDSGRAANLFNRTLKSIFLIIFPLVFVIVVFAHEGLSLWLGSEFADNSTVVLQVLAIGVFINSHAHVPYALLQAAGRADITAKLHLIELPFYLLILWWLVNSYGIVGVAIAWSVRVALDCLFLFLMVRRFLPENSRFTIQIVLKACGALLVLFIGAAASNVIVQLLLLLLGIPIFVVVSWFFILAAEEREMINTRLKLLS